MIETLCGYLSHDRRRAIAPGKTLPDRAQGTALFADISGFTPLTERLAETLGPRRGVEALSHHLNTIYDALIAQVEQFGGSVVGFAGDAIICWFDGERSATSRAVACAFAMHQAMQAFEALSLPDGSTLAIAVKIAIASGTARRFAVGDPNIQLQDVLAGEIVDRMAVAEFLASRGEVIADATTIEWLNGQENVAGWRTDARHPDATQPYAVLTPIQKPNEWNDSVQSSPDGPAPSIELLRPWMLPAVFNRIVSGQGEFLTELRPGVAVFTQFVGIDFEKEEAHSQLDALVRRIQTILVRYDGTLIDLTVGDKGSYFHACFGVLAAHEDDARRAVHAALEFQQIPLELPYLRPLQTGMSCGTLRTGTYGGRTRRTYGVLGDDVNLAARLMEAAQPGEILVSGRVQAVVDRDFTDEPRGVLSVKGKTESVPVFAITGIRRRNIRLLEPEYVLPMVGRRAELGAFAKKLAQAKDGKGQIIGVVAEAGMGKSRLVMEMIYLAEQQGFTGLGGACQSSGGNTPYLVWQPIWLAFFELTQPGEVQATHLETCLQKLAPHRVEALPLLSPLLGISLPENDFTQALDPEFRKLALEALLVDCLKGYFAASQAGKSREAKLLIVLEDLHWADALSRDLLEEIARACATLPVMLILAYRPFEAHYQQPLELEKHPSFSRFALSEMTSTDIQALIRARLAYLFPTQGAPHSGPALDAFMDQICERAQGNPFFAEELLNFIHDQALDPYDPDVAEKIELPNSLHQLILSRIDQLTDREKTTLKIASVIGRLFPVAWLHGYYPALGTMEQIKADLEELRHLDLTPLDTPEPDLTYLFKHIVTQEVTYESLPFDLRARLHEQLAHYLEQANTQTRTSLFDLLAFHYGRSENKTKQVEYFRKAGEAAQAAYANQAALDYYTRLLLLLNPHEQIEILLKRGAVYELMGNWDAAQTDYEHALLHAQNHAPSIHSGTLARCQQALGVMSRWRGEYDQAMEWLEKARQGWLKAGNQEELLQTLVHIGIIHWRKGDFAAARAQLEDSLNLARTLNHVRGMAFAANNLGNVAWRQGDHAAAQQFHEESLALRRQLGGKRGIAVALNNLGAVAHEQGHYAKAKSLYEESLALAREMGDKQGISLSLDNLGMVAQEQGEHTTARALFQESLVLAWELGDKPGILSCLSNLGAVAQQRGDFLEARHLHEQGLTLAREIGDKFNTRMILHHLGHIAFQQEDYPSAQAMFLESWELSQEIGDKRGLAHSVLGAGVIEAWGGDPSRAVQILAAAETIRTEIQQAWEASTRPLYDHALDTLRARLGDSLFNTCWQTGTQIPLDAIRTLITHLSQN